MSDTVRVVHCSQCKGTGMWQGNLCDNCYGTGHVVTTMEAVSTESPDSYEPTHQEGTLIQPDLCPFYDEGCKPGDACDDCELAYQ